MMYYYGNGHMGGWGWALMTITMVVFWGLLIAGAVALFRHFSTGPQPPTAPPPANAGPEQILAERFARGEIDVAEYHDRLDVLRGRAKS